MAHELQALALQERSLAQAVLEWAPQLPAADERVLAARQVWPVAATQQAWAGQARALALQARAA